MKVAVAAVNGEGGRGGDRSRRISSACSQQQREVEEFNCFIGKTELGSSARTG